MRKLLAEGPKETDGYRIDWDSVVAGVNPFTGLSYYKYTEVRNQYETESRPWERGYP